VIVFRKDMSILEALDTHPGARAVFERYGMTCSLCLEADHETIEAGAIMHSVDVIEVLQKLNELPAILS
jgi:hybrid cluster-associated redox disulfide protein